MENDNTLQHDEVAELVKDARILMLTIQVRMSQCELFRVPFSKEQREQIFEELKVMQDKLSSIDSDVMVSSVTRDKLILMRARVKMLEHEVIDFVNQFHLRKRERDIGWERDNKWLPKLVST